MAMQYNALTIWIQDSESELSSEESSANPTIAFLFKPTIGTIPPKMDNRKMKIPDMSVSIKKASDDQLRKYIVT